MHIKYTHFKAPPITNSVSIAPEHEYPVVGYYHSRRAGRAFYQIEINKYQREIIDEKTFQDVNNSLTWSPIIGERKKKSFITPKEVFLFSILILLCFLLNNIFFTIIVLFYMFAHYIDKFKPHK
jgi:hypothetical protein